jgi:chromosome segregation ATPase
MQYPKTKSFLFVVALMLDCVVLLGAQTPPPTRPAQPTKQQRPTKHPTQFDKIIDTEDKPAENQPTEEKAETPVVAPKNDLLPSDALVKAVENLTVEVKNLVGEVRANNARQQIQTDILRLTRTDLRIDRYEAELKTVRDRLALLEADYQNLQMLLTPEALEAQVSRMPYANKGDAIRQVKDSHEARLRAVTAEREIVQRREKELADVVKAFRDVGAETEKRLQAIEETLKKLAETTDQASKPKPDTP